MTLVVWDGEGYVGVGFEDWTAVENGVIGLSDFLLEKGLDCYFDPLENVFEVFEDQFFVLDSDRSHC